MSISQIIGASIADGTIAAIDITDGTITTAKLAATTGSGSVVLSASPTITGNLTVSGTQTNSALTSGRITYASTGGLLTDSSALTFDGTTVTATKFAGALNGSLGATTPSTVVATSVTNSSLTAGRVTYANTGGLLTDSSNLQFDGSNLGIGVTPSAWHSSFKAVQTGLGAAVYGRTATQDQAGLSVNYYYDGANLVYIGNGYANRYEQESGSHKWFNAPSGTTGNQITFTQAMTLDASGYLGIGTTSPSSFGGLAVRKAATVSSVPVSASFSDSANSTFDIRHSPNIVNLNAQGSGITINTGNSTRITITDAGLVGIGTTSPSASGTGGTSKVLEVNGGAGYGILNLSTTATANGSTSGLLQFCSELGSDDRLAVISAIKDDASTTTPKGYLYFSTANAGTITERMRITSAGNVGIGTISPNQKLTLGSSDGTQALSFVTSAYMGDNALIGNIEFSTNGAGGGYDNLVNIKAYKTGTNTNSGDLTFWTKNDGSVSEKVRINKSGQVGIGTTDPIRPLQIGAYGSGNGEIAIASGTSGWGSILFGDGSSGSDFYRGYIQYQHSGDYMLFSTATAERMRITSAGLVGIGTTTPNAKLSINTTTFTSVADTAQVAIENTDAWTQGLAFYIWGAGTYNSGYASGYIGSPNTSGSLFMSGGARVVDNPGGGVNWAKSLNTTAASFINVGESGLYFYSNSGLTANTVYTPSSRFSISTVGDVGVNASGMNTNIIIGRNTSNANYGAIALNGNNADGSRVGFTGGGNSDTNLYNDVPNTGKFVWRQGSASTNVMTLDANGKLLVGCTNDNGGLVQLQKAGSNSAGSGEHISFRLNDNGNYATMRLSTSGNLCFDMYGAGWFEAMRITSAGYVGIGTTSPTYGGKLSVYGDIIVTRNAIIGINGDSVAAGTFAFRNSSAVQKAAIATYYNVAEEGAIEFVNGTTTNMIMRSSGNVGIGDTSPTARLVSYTSTVNQPSFTATTTLMSGGYAALITAGSNNGDYSGGTVLRIFDKTSNGGGGQTGYGVYIASPYDGTNATGNTYALTKYGLYVDDIYSYYGVNNATSNANWGIYVKGGANNYIASNLLVGCTSAPSSSVSGVIVKTSGVEISAGSSTGLTYLMAFINGNGTVGNINVNGSTTAYATSSDYRLKNTIAPMTGALAKVALLKPVTYKWNSDGSNGEGFIAHELAEVVPDCVTGEKDAIDADGKPIHQGVDTSFLVATLTKAIQEQQALIESLTTRLTALEGK
jgi:hypothetical protein